MRRSDRLINRYSNRYMRLCFALNRLAAVCNGCTDVTVVLVAQITGILAGSRP